MTEDRYFAKDTEDAFELERLRHLQEMFKGVTQRRLLSAGVTAGWRCLDVGAGEGSVARWLAERVGPEGHVVATDINPRFLRSLSEPNIEVRAHNILEDDIEVGHYDLVHCRALLMHLPDYMKALRRMVLAVRPGGRLCIEEGDYGMFAALDATSAEGERFTRAFQACFGALRASGKTDTLFGRRVREILGSVGLVDVEHDGYLAVSRGDEASAHFHRMMAAVLRTPFVAAGVASADDFDVLDRAFTTPQFAFLDVALFGACGRRPT